MRTWPLFPALLLAAAVPTHGANLHVLNERAESISVIDLSTNAVSRTISIADPDRDGRPDPPAALTLSNSPAHRGDHAFVAQGRFLRVVNLASGTVVRTHDIAAITGHPGLALAACESAPPRIHLDSVTGAPELKSYLHLAATTPTGDACFFVFDQEQLFLTAPGPAAGEGVLGLGTALGVEVLEEPHGSMFQRAWYSIRATVGTQIEVQAVLVQSGRPVGSPWSVAKRKRFPVPLPPRPSLRIGAPAGGGELPVLPTGPAGTLQNLDAAASSCSLGSDVTAVSVTGPGLASYTVLALRSDAGELVEVDARNCVTNTIPTGANPVDVATLGTIDWGQAFTANHDGDSVTRVKRDGTTTTIPIGPGGGACVHCPIALAAPGVGCVATDLRAEVRDADADGRRDDLSLQWSGAGCPSATTYTVWCMCADDSPACPCRCDCSLPVPPAGCACGGTTSFSASEGAIQLEPPVSIQENPWKILGVTAGTSLNAIDLGGGAGSVDLNVTAEP